MARRIIGLDLGSYSVKMVRLEIGSKASQFSILNVAETPIEIPEKEPEGDSLDWLLERQKAIVQNFQAQGLLDGESFAAGLSGFHAQMREMPAPFTETRKIEAVLPGILEAEVPFHLDEMLVSWYLAGSLPIKTVPALETDYLGNLHVAFGKREVIRKTLDMLLSLHIDPRLLHMNAAALYEMVRFLGPDLFFGSQYENGPEAEKQLSALVDFGHETTNLCIFNQKGMISARSILQGGKLLSQAISTNLGLSFAEAQIYKNAHASLMPVSEQMEASKKIASLVSAHYEQLSEQIRRSLLAVQMATEGAFKNVYLLGGASKVANLDRFLYSHNKGVGCQFKPLVYPRANKPFLPDSGLAFGLAFAGGHVHPKELRFNFRKDEFAWRGELDFLRANSVSLMLWGLVFICALVVYWFTSHLVVNKELAMAEMRQADFCESILNKKSKGLPCLQEMKGQISSEINSGIPALSAADIFNEIAQKLPPDLSLKVTELDISDKKVRWKGETISFEAVDKIVSSLASVPCFTNIEKGRASLSPSGKGVSFQLSNDIDCSHTGPAAAQASLLQGK